LRVDGDRFATEFNKVVAQVPDWAIADIQEMFHSSPCAGDWSSAAGGAGGGSFDVRTNGQDGQVWHEEMGFQSTTKASEAVERLKENLTSCTFVDWQAWPVAQAGTVLASSDQGLLWVHHRGKGLSILSAVTDDGPPPLDVQVEIADLMSSSLAITRDQQAASDRSSSHARQ
jgi:hypothetical protein